MAKRDPFQIGEWYHCFNRGVDKRKVFLEPPEYERFLMLMFASNNVTPIHISNLKVKNLRSLLKVENPAIANPEHIVDIGAYCLMPNHVHIVVKETRSGGIAAFMQKVFTGYAMYFNKRNNRTGPLFSGVFKSRHVADDRYFKHLVAYVHLNPAERADANWKKGKGDLKKIEALLKSYPYSSLPDFLDVSREQRKILSNDVFDVFDSKLTVKQLITDAQAYYAGRENLISNE